MISTQPSKHILYGKYKSQAGFTLAEILMVLVILGLMTGAVLMTQPSEKAPEIEQAEILALQIGRLQQDTIISGQASALGLSDTHYAFYRHEGEAWNSHGEGHDWADNVRVSVKVEGADIKLPDPHEIKPMIFFEPIGPVTPFSLTLSGYQTQRVLVSDGSGRLVIKDREDAGQ